MTARSRSSRATSETTASTSSPPRAALWVLEAEGPRRLTDPETIDLDEVGSHITAVGDDFLVQDSTRGRVRLLRVSRSGDVAEILGGDLEVAGHAAAADRIVAAVATPDSFGELVVLEAGAPRTLTAFGASAAAAGIAAPRELTIDGRDGYPVHGWVAKPAGDGPFPVILQIHGGPHASYGIHLFDETQVLVDAGYAVVYCNPRGSAGYGRAHGRVIRQAMGTVDFTDVIDFLDGAVAADPSLDGVAGGRHGRFVRRVPHRVGDRARSPLRRGDRGARLPRPDLVPGHERHRRLLRRRVRRHRRRRDRTAESDGGRRSGHARRPSSSTPSWTSAARSSRRRGTTARSSARGRMPRC